MTADRFRTRCLGCGKWTRRSLCSDCRRVRAAAKVEARGGRYAAKAARKRRRAS